MKIMHILADTTNRIAEGEVLQLINKNNPETNESSYREVIYNKTAILFQAAAHCAALLSDAPDATADSLKRFGKHIGLAFQLIDDALDYDGDAEMLGKNLGDDLAEGKPTLPLIHALQHADNTERDLIRQCLIRTEPTPPQTLNRITAIIKACGSLQYTRDAAEEEARLALACVEELPVSDFTDTLELLAKFSIARNK
jgi:octaprenyl-diphosphate synthase